MPSESNTLEEQLNEKGITGWYIMKPNRLYAKDQNTNRYITTDVIAEGTAAEVINAISEVGDTQISDINALGQEELRDLQDLQSEYDSTKAIMIRSCRSLRTYFSQQGMQTVVAILDNTISSLNAL